MHEGTLVRDRLRSDIERELDTEARGNGAQSADAFISVPPVDAFIAAPPPVDAFIAAPPELS